MLLLAVKHAVLLLLIIIIILCSIHQVCSIATPDGLLLDIKHAVLLLLICACSIVTADML